MENKNHLGPCLALLVVLTWGCVKDPQDIPPGLTSDPVFGLSGVLGTQGLNIDAGVDNWTVQPTIEIMDSNIVYTSLFSQNGCVSDCSPSYEIKFYAAWPPAQNSVSGFQETIHTGDIDFVGTDAERTRYDVLLSTHPGLFMSGYSYWEDLNIPETFYLSDYRSVIDHDKQLDVCFQSYAFTGCQYRQCISFDPATLLPCLTHIEAELEDERYLRIEVKPRGTPPFQVAWWNGSTASSIIVPLQDPATEVYVDVTTTDGNGNISQLSQSIRINQGNVDACYFPVELSSEPLLNISPAFAAGKVEIIYTDESGEVWRTTAGEQTNASFQISDISYYGLSPQAQPAYKTAISAVTHLFNETTGESKQLVIQQAVIALAHP